MNQWQRETVRIVGINPQGTSGPSLGFSLGLLAATLTGVAAYTSYKLYACNETVFIPLWLCSKKRPPYKSELDREAFIDHVKCKLLSRLAIDEELAVLMGVGVEIPGDDADTFDVYVRSSGPGITGIMVETPLKFSLTSRPFSSSGFDSLFPSGSDAPDQNEFVEGSVLNSRLPHEGSRPSFYEAVVDGRVRVKSANGTNRLTRVDDCVVQFRASQSLNHSLATPKFSNTFVEYKDATGTTVTKRLW